MIKISGFLRGILHQNHLKFPPALVCGDYQNSDAQHRDWTFYQSI
jgi:hypothetical protein